MDEHDRASQKLRRTFEPVLGEPEATILMDRLVTRRDIMDIVHSEMEVLGRDLRSEIRMEVQGVRVEVQGVRVEVGGVRAEVQRTARQNLLAVVTVVGILNATLFAALKLV